MSAPAPQTRHLALLRAINVGGRNKVPMAELRALASGLGFGDVSTYIASGNLLFSSEKSDADGAAALTVAIAERFGLTVDVVVVGGEVLRRAALQHPFADGDPKRVHVGFGSAPIGAAVLDRLRSYASASERVAADGTLLFADFADGVQSSALAARLTSAFRPGFVTLRNLATTRTLQVMLGD